MIGAHGNPPRIVDQQVPFETDRPLQRMNKTTVAVSDRNNATTAFQFHISAEPFPACDFMEIVPQRTIARHGCCFAEHNLPHVDGQQRMAVHMLGQCGNLRTERRLIIKTAAITVKLNMCQMSS